MSKFEQLKAQIRKYSHHGFRTGMHAVSKRPYIQARIRPMSTEIRIFSDAPDTIEDMRIANYINTAVIILPELISMLELCKLALSSEDPVDVALAKEQIERFDKQGNLDAPHIETEENLPGGFEG